MILSYGGTWRDEFGVVHEGNVRRIGGHITGHDVVDTRCSKLLRDWNGAVNQPTTCIACIAASTIEYRSVHDP